MKVILLLLCSCVFAFCGQDANVPVLSQKQLEKSVQYWSHILRLDDVDVTAVMVPIEQLPANSAGASKCEWNYGACQIAILRPDNYDKLEGNELVGKEILKDIENTIVHELVHIRLYKLTELNEKNPECITTSHCQKIEEMTVIRLTSALLEGREPIIK